MRKMFGIGLVAVLAAVSFANADIISNTAMDDGDGAVECTGTWDNATGASEAEVATMQIVGNQNWAPGHVLGTVTTDTELDPIMWIRNSIENDTSMVWTGFEVSITMNKPFTILATETMPTWSATPIAPVLVGASYIGHVNFAMNSGGDPVSPTETGQFDYKVSFVGSIQYCQEMVPTPEPASLVLLGLGGLLIGRRRVRA